MSGLHDHTKMRPTVTSGLRIATLQQHCMNVCGQNWTPHMVEVITGKIQAFSVSFPPKELSPNARLHWSKVNRAKKVHQSAVWAAMLSQKIRKMGDDQISFEMTFYPPSGRKFDDDNLVRRMKGARDEIARFIGVDDNIFSMAAPVIAGKEPPFGRVAIVLRPSMIDLELRDNVTWPDPMPNP